MKQPSYVGFEPDKYAWKKDIDYRAKPHLFRVGKGQQGVLTCEPYKSEIGAHWRFKTPEKAKKSSKKGLTNLVVCSHLASQRKFFEIVKSIGYPDIQLEKKIDFKANKWTFYFLEQSEIDFLEKFQEKNTKINPRPI